MSIFNGLKETYVNGLLPSERLELEVHALQVLVQKYQACKFDEKNELSKKINERINNLNNYQL